MSLRTQVLVWVGFSLVAILLIWLFRPILLPFLIGIALAYVLNPAVNFVQRSRISRGWSSLLVLLAVLGLIIGVILVITPLVVTQIASLLSRLPGYVSDLQHLVQQIDPQLRDWLGADRAAQLETFLAQFLGSGIEFIGGITAQVAQSGLTVLNTVVVLFLTPVIAFYLLLDWEGMVKSIDDLLPREHRREVRTVLDEIDRSMAGVIRGQGGIMLVLCVYYGTALTLTGLNFGLVIGLLTGLLSFVPFLGFITGFVLSMGIAGVQYAPNWWFVGIVFITYVIGQFLEANILYPRLVGQSININPVWLIFALFAFAFLFGVVGLLLAVPLSAITATLIRYAVRRYKGSALYRGERPAKPMGEEALLVTAAPEGVVASPVPKPRSRRSAAEPK
jgi:predicted PurR-regulated permease PerM